MYLFVYLVYRLFLLSNQMDNSFIIDTSNHYTTNSPVLHNGLYYGIYTIHPAEIAKNINRPKTPFNSSYFTSNSSNFMQSHE